MSTLKEPDKRGTKTTMFQWEKTRKIKTLGFCGGFSCIVCLEA